MGTGGGNVSSAAGPSGEALTLLGALAAIQLSRGRSTDQLALLAAFFTVLGDNLALIATGPPL